MSFDVPTGSPTRDSKPCDPVFNPASFTFVSRDSVGICWCSGWYSCSSVFGIFAGEFSGAERTNVKGEPTI